LKHPKEASNRYEGVFGTPSYCFDIKKQYFFCSALEILVTLASLKILAFGNAQIHLAFPSFIRIFADMKKAIIMGASSGMGYEVAKLLLEDGWQVGVAARRTELLEDLKTQYDQQVETEKIDVTDEDSPRKLLDLVGRLGGIDLYFHVSGIGKQNPDIVEEIEMNTVNTNAVGFTRLVDTMFNYMKENGGGQIAVISSIAGTKGLGPAPSYSATKAFQNTYIQALEQLSNNKKYNIRFTDIRPGFVDTPLLAGGHYPMLMNQQYVARKIVKAIYAKKHVQVIDWRYSLLTRCWRLIPNFIWRHIKLCR
jgi:short-subunit dehydrogenase